MRLQPAAIAVLVAVALPALAACGDQPESPDRAGASSLWQRLPDPPLSPREGTLGISTGSEALIIGGSDAPPCPPNADCITPRIPPLADGAAFDPVARAWRRIADAPVGLVGAVGTTVGRTAYVWVNGVPQGGVGRPGSRRAFLAYEIDRDRWQELPLPPRGGSADYSITSAEDRVVAFRESDEGGESPDSVFDPRRGSWRELPADPLSPLFDRATAWSGSELTLFGTRLVPNPGAEAPAFVRAAALDLESGAWRRLPDSEIVDLEFVTTERWYEVDERLVNPAIGSIDGVGRWDRAYPQGGVLDPASGEWSELPDRPDRLDPNVQSSGILTPSGGHYYGHVGWILDTVNDKWIEIPQLLADASSGSRTVVAAGDEMLVFGGSRFGGAASNRGKLLNQAWAWSPR